LVRRNVGERYSGVRRVIHSAWSMDTRSWLVGAYSSDECCDSGWEGFVPGTLRKLEIVALW